MPIRFGNFELDEQRFELRRDGVPVAIQPRVLEALAFLARRSGTLVSKEELIAGPWKGTPVSDAALSQAIRQARAALGEDRGAPRFIETVRGKGFRFHADSVDAGEYLSEPPASPRPRPFFGRESELERLRAAAHEARSGQGKVIVLHGAAGVGKTRLTQWFTTLEREQGAEICWGGCREGQSAPPFWPWPEVLHRYAESRDAETIQALARGMQSELVAVAPELHEALGIASGAGRAESPERAASVLASTAGFLRRASLENPLIVVLEDLHLADDAALQLLEAVASSIADTHLLLIGTCRSAEGQARPVLSAALEGSLPHFHQVELAGLPLATVREWLVVASPTSVPDEVVAALHYSTEGLPLLLENVVDALPSEWDLPKLASEPQAGFALPDKVRHLLRRRLDELDQRAVEVLRMAAVFGEEFPLGMLAAASQQSMSTLLRALDDAEQSGLLSPANRGQMRFAHALHRDLLYHELSTTERHEYHLRAARAFADQTGVRPELVVQAAHHFLLAAPTSDPVEVVDYARRAAEWARSRHAYARAAQYYQRALDAIELAPFDSRARCELLHALGHTQYVAGMVDDALETLDRTFELSRSYGFHDLFCQALLTYFSVRRESLPVDKTFHRRISQALANLTKKDAVYARLQVARAMAGALTTPVADRVSWLEEALALTRVGAAPRDRLEVLSGALRCYTNFTDGTAILELAQEQIVLANRLESPETELEAKQWRAEVLLNLGRGVEFEQQCIEYTQRAAIVGSPHAVWAGHVLEAGRLFLAGSLLECGRLVREAVAAGEGLMGIGAVAHTAALLLPLALEQAPGGEGNHIDFAVQQGDRALAVAPNYQPMVLSVALLRLYRGEAGPASECLKRFLGAEFAVSDLLDRNMMPMLVLLANMACVQRHVAAASKIHSILSKTSTPHAAGASGGFYGGPVSYWLGRLSTTLAQSAQARTYLEMAMQESERATSVTYRAWSAFHLAQVLSEDEASRKQRLLESAREAAHRYGIGRLKAAL